MQMLRSAARLSTFKQMPRSDGSASASYVAVEGATPIWQWRNLFPSFPDVYDFHQSLFTSRNQDSL